MYGGKQPQCDSLRGQQGPLLYSTATGSKEQKGEKIIKYVKQVRQGQ